jgi:hypothetical protein
MAIFPFMFYRLKLNYHYFSKCYFASCNDWQKIKKKLKFADNIFGLFFNVYIIFYFVLDSGAMPGTDIDR